MPDPTQSLAQRALVLHELKVINLQSRCGPGCMCGEKWCGQLSLSDGAILLACVRAKVRVFPGYGTADGEFYGVQLEHGHTNSGWKTCPVDAALSALEAANGP